MGDAVEEYIDIRLGIDSSACTPQYPPTSRGALMSGISIIPRGTSAVKEFKGDETGVVVEEGVNPETPCSRLNV